MFWSCIPTEVTGPEREEPRPELRIVRLGIRIQDGADPYYHYAEKTV